MANMIIATRRWLDGDDQPSAVALIAVTLGLFVAAFYAIERTLTPGSGAASSVAAQLAAAATLATAAATGLGAIPVLFMRRISARTNDTMLGFGAGVMLAASVFSLILPALASGAELTGSKLAGGLVTVAGIAMGGALLLIMDHSLPHEHLVKGHEGGSGRNLARVWLFVFAITLHNVPEGLAVGVSLAGGDPARGLPLALGIGIQNMPEGLAVALAMLTLKYPPARAMLIALVTGLVEPIGGMIGAGTVSLAAPLLPWGLAFAAGAMLFVISHEIIPESHRNGHETFASIGLFAGFSLMMMFDTALA